MPSKPKKEWTLTEETWGGLIALLAPDPDRAAELYLVMHAKLVTFFEHRNSPDPVQHADEVFDRVSRKIAEGVEINNPMSYCYGVARMLQKEIYTEAEHNRVAVNGFYSDSNSSSESEEEDNLTAACLHKCLEQMPEDERQRLLEYYEGSARARIEQRKKMAQRLKVTLNGLRIDIYRSRMKLQQCTNRCCAEPGE
jgi:DNA-directed RNA polymerase specialized sigma24 family protein